MAMDTRWIKYGASLFLGIVLIIILISLTGMDKVAGVLLEMDWLYLAPIVAIYSLDWLIRGERWRVLLAQNMIRISLYEAVVLTLLGNFANLVMPAKLGDLARVYGAKKRHAVKVPVGLTTTVIDRFLDFLAVLLLSVVSLSFIVRQDMPAWSNTFIYASIAVVLAAAVSLKIIGARNLARKVFVGPLKRFEKYYEEIEGSLFDSVRHRKTCAKLLAYSLAVWFLEALMTYMLVLSTSFPVALSSVVFAIMIANLTKTLPLTPGGLGVYEGAMAAILAANGLPYEVCLTVSIIDHAIKNLYTLILGGISAGVFGLHLTEGSKIQMRP